MIKVEKRKYPRKKASTILKVYDLNTGEYLGTVANISPGGILLITHLAIEANSVYQLRIELSSDQAVETITFGGEILWIDHCRDSNKNWAGVAIIDISEGMIDRINQLIMACLV